jgi:hypothetical protein
MAANVINSKTMYLLEKLKCLSIWNGVTWVVSNIFLAKLGYICDYERTCTPIEKNNKVRPFWMD